MPAKRVMKASHDLPPPLRLPKPKLTGGRTVVEALRRRQTIHAIRAKRLTAQQLSNLLWAAWGVNRKKGPFDCPGRTAASASNSQEIDIYVALEEGVYLFDAVKHELVPSAAIDLRLQALGRGQPNSSPDAPVQLIYVAEIDRLVHTQGYDEPGLRDPEVQKSYFFVDTGLIAANVYLFAASAGLAAWFHNCDKEAIAKKLKLRKTQRVLFAQTVGYAAHH